MYIQRRMGWGSEKVKDFREHSLQIDLHSGVIFMYLAGDNIMLSHRPCTPSILGIILHYLMDKRL